MRTPPHLPARSRREHGDAAAHAVRRHPYGLRDTLDLIDPTPPPDTHVEQRLLDIREMSNQAIGSIDDLLTHTA
ncbi:hypothetical protein AB0I81_03800 [Nonomuraea sp. NPDC050404]|uniref:hypothetical protein n=1 Tax=Nonomuraea sp. NPDC050404 TaxID=3155783 RepID=UPI003401F1BE